MAAGLGGGSWADGGGAERERVRERDRERDRERERERERGGRRGGRAQVVTWDATHTRRQIVNFHKMYSDQTELHE